MTDSAHGDRQTRDRLRAYLLETLPETERAELASRLAASAELRAALETERAALARLDALPEIPPPLDLTTRVMRKVRARETAPVSARTGRRVLRLAATVTITAALVASLALLPALSRMREAAHRATSANNLKQLGIVIKMYANESRGEYYPPLAPIEGVWGIDVSVLYPKYLADPNVLIDPGHPRADAIRAEMAEAIASRPIDWTAVNRLAAESYAYLGWGARGPGQLAQLRDARPQLRSSDPDSLRSIEQETEVYRLREGIERFFITDINNPAASVHVQSEIPVLFEARPASPDGRHVLYMDGAVRFVKYGESFPATLETDAILGIVPLEAP